MNDSNYFWVRIFDYNHERDGMEKGSLLDEFYLKDIPAGREGAKKEVLERYCSNTSKELKFAKPRKKDGIYAIVMDSESFFYNRFYTEVDTHCFYCLKPVKGKACDFPRTYIPKQKSESKEADSLYLFHSHDDLSDLENTYFFCCYDHKHDYHRDLNYEGEFQSKEAGSFGDVFGYIYLIYNRSKDIYYIGQTKFMPFFRWQEHVKDGSKGDICDLSFSVLAEIHNHNQSESNQEYLNNMESWWIGKFKEEGKQVFNVTQPKMTIETFRERFNDMVKKQEALF